MMRTFLSEKKRFERAAAALVIMTVLFIAFSFGNTVMADVSALDGKKLGGTMFNSVLLISHSLGSAIEPISILMVEAVIALCAKVIPDVLGKYTQYLGFMNNTVMSLVIILLFVILKAPKMFGVTRVGGIAIEEIENKAMGLFNFSLPFLMFMVEEDSTAGSARTVKSGAAAIVASGGWETAGKILLCTVLGIYLVLSYIVMRTVLYAGDVLITMLAVIPGVSMVVEVFKTLAVIFIVIISLVAPPVLIGIYVVLLLSCILLFKKAYKTTTYYRHIYFYPIFTGAAKKKKKAEELKKEYEATGELVIPAFLGSSFRDFERFERCFVTFKNGKAIVSKNRNPKEFSDEVADSSKNKKRKSKTFIMSSFPGNRYLIRKGRRFIEIYKQKEEKKKRSRIFAKENEESIVISRVYADLFPLMADAGSFEREGDKVSENTAPVTV